MKEHVDDRILARLEDAERLAFQKMNARAFSLYRRLGRADDIADHPLYVPLLDFLCDPCGDYKSEGQP